MIGNSNYLQFWSLIMSLQYLRLFFLSKEKESVSENRFSCRMQNRSSSYQLNHPKKKTAPLLLVWTNPPKWLFENSPLISKSKPLLVRERRLTVSLPRVMEELSRDLPGVEGASPWLPSDECFLSHDGEEIPLPLTLLAGWWWGCRGEFSMLRLDPALGLGNLLGVSLLLDPPSRWCGEAAVGIRPRFDASISALFPYLTSPWFWNVMFEGIFYRCLKC